MHYCKFQFMNLDKLEFVQEQSRNDGFVIDGKIRSLKPNEFHYRCNYLYKAASLLYSRKFPICWISNVNFKKFLSFANISSLESDSIGLRILSKLYLREMKELCLVEMIRLEKDFGRTTCKRCKNIFVARLDGTQSITVR